MKNVKREQKSGRNIAINQIETAKKKWKIIIPYKNIKNPMWEK